VPEIVEGFGLCDSRAGQKCLASGSSEKPALMELGSREKATPEFEETSDPYDRRRDFLPPAASNDRPRILRGCSKSTARPVPFLPTPHNGGQKADYFEPPDSPGSYMKVRIAYNCFLFASPFARNSFQVDTRRLNSKIYTAAPLNHSSSSSANSSEALVPQI
jgi:hypothetical protein